jgi:hypothetical protein
MKKFYKLPFFTKVPLGGYYKYKDVFQIFPADFDNMPKSKLQRHFINILEYWTTEDELKPIPGEFEGIDPYSEYVAIATKKDKFLALLTAFTNNIFFNYTNTSGSWGIPVLSEDLKSEEINSWKSIWCMPYFHWPELPDQLKIKDFTVQRIESIKRVDHKIFYTNDPNLDYSSKENIVFPSSIDEIIDAYFILDSTMMGILDSAISYTVAAMDLKESKKTLSLLASFTSVETMVNLEYKELIAEKCTTCGQLKYSVARKFREYLLKYIGHSEKNKKKFNSYYSLRSKIVHTGCQLKTELLFADVPAKEKEEELITRIEILQIGKLAITNWLLAYNNPELLVSNKRE